MLTPALLPVAALLLAGCAAPALLRLRSGGMVLRGGVVGACLGLVAVGGVALAGAMPPDVPPDGLSAWALLILGTCGALAAVPAGAGPLAAALWPVALAGLALSFLAEDGATLALGAAVASLALRGAVTGRPSALPVAGAVLLAAAFGLAEEGGVFAAAGPAPPGGVRAGVALVLAVAGAATLAVPWRGASAEVLVGAAVGMPLLALYMLARLPDPFGGATPLLAGAALAAAGALRAMLAEELPDILGPLAWAQAGLGAMALGLAALCRAADLPGGAGAAAGAALLLMPVHALTVTLLAIGTAAVARGAASRRLDRLGGLLHAMPWTGWCVLAGALSAAALPPLAGFAGTWLVLQSALGAWRAGGLLQQVAVGLSLALAGLALGLTAAAMIRLLGIAFLGRPRTPRAAGAEDPPWPARLTLLAAAGLLALAGLFPGPVLLLAGAAAEVLVGQDLSARAGPFSITAGDGQGYAPLLLSLLLALAGVAAWAATRGAGPAERGPAWDGGFEAPPPHLPFGDPATQPSAAGFAEPVRRILGGGPRLPAVPALPERLRALLEDLRRPGIPPRHPLLPALLTLAGLLVLLGLGE